MPNDADKPSVPVMIVAVIVLLGFAGLLYYMFTISSGADERLWTRAIFLYGAVEALAFAAAGFLFGREVHRQRAEKAEERADEKTQEAQTATAQAAHTKGKGEALKKAVAEKLRTPARTELYGALGSNNPAAAQRLAQSDLEEIAGLARELFPD